MIKRLPYHSWIVGLALSAIVVTACSPGERNTSGDAYPAAYANLPAVDALTFETYHNKRFDYEVAYPAGLVIPEGEPDGRQGQRFVGPDTAFAIHVHGWHSSRYDLIEQVYDDYRREAEQAGKHILNEDLLEGHFLVTSQAEDYIAFEQIKLREGVVLTVEVIVDYRLADRMQPVIDHVMASFKG